MGFCLSTNDYRKVERFLSSIKPYLKTGEFKVKPSSKNNEFDKKYNLKHKQKTEILCSLCADDCVKIAPNDNPRYEDNELFVFQKNVELEVYGEQSQAKLYIKMYLTQNSVILVISFHEEGMFD